MKVLPTSYSDELDVEIDSPESITELEEGNFSRLYPVLQEYRKLNAKGEGTKGGESLGKKLNSIISGKKKKPTGKNPDFKKINLVFPEEVLDDWETHSRLDGIKDKFREYCSIERKRERKTTETLNLVKDGLIFGGTIAVTYGLGFLAYFGYISVLKETPLLISAAADVVLAAGFGVRHKEMAHRDKVEKIEMVDDAELNFVTGDEYRTLLVERKNSMTPSAQDKRKDAKMPEVTRTVEVNCCDFFENERFSTDGLVEKYMELYPEKKESLYKRLSNYVNKKILRKKSHVPGTKEAVDEERLRLIVYAKESCEIVPRLQEKFRTYCRTERMKAEKTANLAERVKDIVTFAGPVVTTYGLSLAVYEGLIEVARHMPLIIDTAADGVLVSGLIPRKVEIGYRERAKLLEKFENAEIDIVSQPSYGACPRKGFYSQTTGQA